GRRDGRLLEAAEPAMLHRDVFVALRRMVAQRQHDRLANVGTHAERRLDARLVLDSGLAGRGYQAVHGRQPAERPIRKTAYLDALEGLAQIPVTRRLLVGEPLRLTRRTGHVDRVHAIARVPHVAGEVIADARAVEPHQANALGPLVKEG